MKKIFVPIIILLFIQKGFSQEQDTTAIKVGRKNIVTITEDSNRTDVRILENDVIVNVNEKDDTVRIKLGKKGITITETDEGTNVEIIDLDDYEKHKWKKKTSKFKGHWAGYELGMNNFLDKDFKFAGTKPENRFLDLNTAKSWNSNINFIQYSLPMSRGSGWITGLGFEWNNYYFDRNNSIAKDSTGYIGPVYPPDGITYQKTKINTTYLTLPLLLEFQFGEKKNGFISFGVIGGLKLHSNTKTKYIDGGSKERSKIKDDLNLSPLRYAITVRAGYKFLKVYANYGMIPVFKENTGPEIYPINLGLILFSF
ncbi:MAG: hypothetical protein AMS27_17510 [Bacteroides sp. SM23_62_1]|nr:MAG: hypothetical protein AMS27_17510 [Bacteroides sp. SM23_62_1]